MPLEKNQLINASFTDYTGGINVSVAPQLLAENEYQQIQNFEYDYSRLRTRAGISPALSSYPLDIKAVYWDKATNTYLVCLVDGSVYDEDLAGNSNLVGTLTGEKGVSFCKFDNKVFVASGGKLQYYDGTERKLKTIDSSYLSSIVFERFGRLVTTVYGDDNLYYSAVGDPYETKYVEVTVTDENGRTTTTIEDYNGEPVGGGDTDITGDAEGSVANTYTATVVYMGGTANVVDGTKPKPSEGSTTQTQSHVIKRVDTYKDGEVVSSAYYLDDELKESEVKEGDLTFEKFTFGSTPSSSTFLPVTDEKDMYYGATYQDIKNPDGTITRNYYLRKLYNVGADKHSIELMYKIEQVRKTTTVSSGLIHNTVTKVESAELSIQKLVIALNSLDSSEIDLEEIILKGTTKKESVSGGTKETTNHTVIKIKDTSVGVVATVYYRTQVVTDTKTSVSSTAASGVVKDHLGRGYGDVLEGGASSNSSLKHTIVTVENDDGTVAEYDYGCDKNAVIKSFTRTLTEVIETSETSGEADWTKTKQTIVTKSVDKGTKTTITTTSTIHSDANTYQEQFDVFDVVATKTETVVEPAFKSTTVSRKVVYTSGWDDDTNRDDSAKILEVGYKDDGDIIKVLPTSGDILVFKSNGNVYSVSGEYPNWSVQLVAAGLDYLNDGVISPVNTQICYLTNKGLNTLQATQTYGNFTTNLAVGNKFNGLITRKLANPAMYNIARKHQLLIQPDVTDQGYMICFQYDIGAAITFKFPLAITCVVDTENGVIFAAGNSLYRWDKQYTNDLGELPIEQEIVTRKFESSRRLYTRQVDVGIEGTPAGLVEFYWADKRLEYFIKHKRRLLNVFSVCRDGIFTIKTKENIYIDYIKFYLFEK